MSAGHRRPASADTMILVLKPRQEDYKHVAAQLSGSENERLAYRKNRVIQMKLGSYLAEVCLQEKSSALILKNEEHRFLQKVSKRSSTPRSVRMLEELHRFVNKKFTNTSIADEDSQATSNKSLNQIPEVSTDQEPPRAAASNKNNTLGEILDKLPSAVGPRKRHVVVADISCLTDKINKIDNSGIKLEFPSIKSNYRTDNCIETFHDSNSFELNTFLHSENVNDGLILPNIADDNNKRIETVNKTHLSFTEQEDDNIKEAYRIQLYDNPEDIKTASQVTPPDKIEELGLGELRDKDFVFDNNISEDERSENTPETKQPSQKQRLRRNSKKSTLNHSQTDRAPPLRHNITSVLRQERTKKEAGQEKVKDHPDKTSTDQTTGQIKFTSRK